MPAFFFYPDYNVAVLRRALIIAFILVTALSFADSAKRLILKNGDYQKVRNYEIKGDRVRYFSAERYQWEEMPSSMVDWDATHKYEADQAKAAEPEVKRIPSPEELQKQAEDAMTPEVAPNLRLPKSGGVFALDTVDGKPQLLELAQNGGQIDEHVGRNILFRRVNPISTNTATIELKGSNSKVQLHVARPVVFLNVDENPDDPETAVARKRYKSRPSSDAYRFQFVKLDKKGDSRVIGKIKTYVTEVSESEQTVLPTFGRIMFGDVWIRIEPKEDLPPGEYAVAEMLPNNEINRYVWDFSVRGGTTSKRDK